MSSTETSDLEAPFLELLAAVPPTPDLRKGVVLIETSGLMKLLLATPCGDTFDTILHKRQVFL